MKINWQNIYKIIKAGFLAIYSFLVIYAFYVTYVVEKASE